MEVLYLGFIVNLDSRLWIPKTYFIDTVTLTLVKCSMDPIIYGYGHTNKSL